MGAWLAGEMGSQGGGGRAWGPNAVSSPFRANQARAKIPGPGNEARYTHLYAFSWGG